MNELKQFTDLLKIKFKKRLDAKTGWGCNDLWSEFNDAVTEALFDMIDIEKKDTEQIDDVPF